MEALIQTSVLDSLHVSLSPCNQTAAILILTHDFIPAVWSPLVNENTANGTRDLMQTVWLYNILKC